MLTGSGNSPSARNLWMLALSSSNCVRASSRILRRPLQTRPTHPASNDMEQWIKRARNFERSHQLQKNLAGTKPSLSPVSSVKPLRSPPSTTWRFAYRTHTLARYPILFVRPDSRSHRNLRFRCLWMWTPPGLRSRNADICRRCGQAGHWAKDCSKAYNVRSCSQMS